MRSIILSSVLNVLIPLFLIFAIFMLFRGHDRPGGGFIAGLIVAIPFMVNAMAFGARHTQQKFLIKPFFIIPIGLLLATLSGVFAFISKQPFLSALWSVYKVPVIGKVGTPTIFDIGVFLIVSGVVLQITFMVIHEDEKETKIRAHDEKGPGEKEIDKEV